MLGEGGSGVNLICEPVNSIRMVRAPDLQFGGAEFKSRSDPLAGFVFGNPKFKSLATLVNSQLVCLQPVGILNPVMFNLNYLFQAFARPH